MLVHDHSDEAGACNRWKTQPASRADSEDFRCGEKAVLEHKHLNPFVGTGGIMNQRSSVDPGGRCDLPGRLRADAVCSRQLGARGSSWARLRTAPCFCGRKLHQCSCVFKGIVRDG